MSFNGTGTFNRIYSWVTDQANGILVRADRMDTDTNDIASGLSNCMTRDGQSPPTADIPMGSQKLTGLANGVAAQDATTVSQVFTSPTFTTPYSAAMPTLGSNNLLLATTSYVDQTAFTTALPSQTGNSGRLVTTNGVTASWAAIPAPTGSIIYLASTQGGF